MIRLWHRIRYVTCVACHREFRRGHGAGLDRSTVCSRGCWENGIRQFLRVPLLPVTWPVES